MLKQTGFTLLEFVMVIVIIAILAGIGSTQLYQGLSSYVQSNDMNTTDWQANAALERLFREIRSVNRSAAITTASASVLTFTNGSNTSLTYQITSGNLVEGANTLASNATALAFTYYDRNGAVTSTIANIRFVKIDLTLTENTYVYTYSTGVSLPNLP